MNTDPLTLERAPRSRVEEWMHFAAEWGMYQQYRTEEAELRARAQVGPAGRAN